MSEKLKPCPFCGGEAEIARYGNSKVSTFYQCNWCGVALETSEEFNHGERWNDRFETPMQKAAPEMYEMLKRFADNNVVFPLNMRNDMHALLAKARGEQ